MSNSSIWLIDKALSVATILVGWFKFYGISTIIGYLMLNPVFR